MQSFEVQLASQGAIIQQQQSEIDQLRGMRKEMVPPQLPVLPARVVSRDIAAARDSLIVARGSTRGAGWQDWVAGRLFLDKGIAADVEQGQAVLSQQTLLGRIEQVSPYMARVQLLTDVDSPRLEVRVAKISNGVARFIDYPCSVRGLGDGRMLVEGVEQRYALPPGEVESPENPDRIAAGDLVFTAAGQLGLPFPIVVGKVVSVDENPRKRLVYNVCVEPLLKSDNLREVFIIPIVPNQPIVIRDKSLP